jgi:hypothetical protein
MTQLLVLLLLSLDPHVWETLLPVVHVNYVGIEGNNIRDIIIICSIQ